MILPSIILFIFGTIIGSFFSVINYRIHNNKKGIFLGRSKCTHCHKKLKVRDLIPLLSYIINGGKCRICKKKIGSHYFLMELFMGAIFVAFYFIYPFFQFVLQSGTHDLNVILNFNPELIFPFVFNTIIGIVLIAIFFYDLLYLEVPEIFTYPLMGFIFIGNLFLGDPSWSNMLIGAAGALLFFGSQVIISKERWLGIGDIQIGLIMGLYFGWQLFVLSLVLTYVFGSIASILLLITKRVKGSSRIPFAPFLVTGFFITLFIGEYLYDLYIQTIL